jgi:hypothetical protein
MTARRAKASALPPGFRPASANLRLSQRWDRRFRLSKTRSRSGAFRPSQEAAQ